VARVLLFGRLADIAGWREKSVIVDTLEQAKTHLAEADSALGAALQAPGVQAAVDRKIVRGDASLAANAEVAFMPPMSGG